MLLRTTEAESNQSSPFLTHIAGTFVIEASASFLNGAGLGEGEDRNVSIVKTFRDGKHRVPYVSAQAWRRWLRNTLIEETGWPPSVLKALIVDPKKGTTKKIGGEFNPVDYPEDDIFGYMRTEPGSGRVKQTPESEVPNPTDVIEDTDTSNSEKEGASENVPADNTAKQVGQKVKPVARASTFSTSILVSLRREGWWGKDDGLFTLRKASPFPILPNFTEVIYKEYSV